MHLLDAIAFRAAVHLAGTSRAFFPHGAWRGRRARARPGLTLAAWPADTWKRWCAPGTAGENCDAPVGNSWFVSLMVKKARIGGEGRRSGVRLRVEAGAEEV